VEVVALGGSRASAQEDAASDVDLYVLTSAKVPTKTRQRIVEQLGGATVANLGHDYFGGGDEWLDAGTGTHLDVMYFGLEWLREQVERAMTHHQPSLGYSTAFPYTVSRAHVLHDPEGKFAALQAESRKPYPEALRQAVVRYNHPMLRGVLSSYCAQLEKAVRRGDLVSVNHRLAALLASYFDVLFALNRALHPGEKRLLAAAQTDCEKLPADMEADVSAVLGASAANETLLGNVNRLLDRLDTLLGQEGFNLAT